MTSPNDSTASGYHTLPEEMQRRPQWVVWKRETDPNSGRVLKVPYCPATGTKASPADSLTWTTFAEALSAYQIGGYDGTGFVLSSGDPFTFLDLDDAFDPDEGERLRALGLAGPFDGFKPWAKPVLEKISAHAYVARSSSGRGAHAILLGKVPGTEHKQKVIRDGETVGKVEIYDSGRFVALTGDTIWSGTLLKGPGQRTIDTVYAHFGFTKAAEGDQRGGAAGEGSTGLSDEEVLRKARNAKNGDKFRALYDRGDLSGHGGDHSAADLALCGLLAFWCGPNAGQIDRLFRASALMRSKWDRPDYLSGTIAEALKGRGPDDYYRKGRNRGEGVSSFSRSFVDDSAKVDPGPAPVFPVETLPSVARSYVDQHAATIGVPPEMVAVPLLVNAAGTIGNTREIELKPGYRQPAVISALVVSPPGTAKTPAMNAARAPLDALQLEASLLYQHLHRQWETQVRDAKSRKEKTAPPDPPVAEHYYTTDATVEALALMVQGSPGLVVSRDELVGFIKAMDAYRKGGDRQAYLSLWAGTALKIDRKTTGTVYVPKPAVSIIGGIQPDLLGELSDEANRQDGFIDRFLMVMPDAGPPKWSEETVSVRTLDRLTKVFRRLRRPKGYGDPVVLRLSPEARSVFREWYDENSGIVLASTGLEAGCYAKYPNQCARLALILHLLSDPDDLTGPIGADTVRDAITLVEYFRASLIRILPKFKVKGTSASAGIVPRVRRVLDRAAGAWVDRTEITNQLHRNETSEAITGALETLQSQGLAESRTLEAGPSGGRPKEQWRSLSARTDTANEKTKKRDNPSSRAEAVADEPDQPFGSPNGSGPHIGVFTPLSRLGKEGEWPQ